MGRGHVWRLPKSIKILDTNCTWLEDASENPKLDSGWIWVDWDLLRMVLCQKNLWRPTGGSKAKSRLYYELLKDKRWPCSSGVSWCVSKWAASPNGHINMDNDDHRYINQWMEWGTPFSDEPNLQEANLPISPPPSCICRATQWYGQRAHRQSRAPWPNRCSCYTHKKLIPTVTTAKYWYNCWICSMRIDMRSYE